jgi:phosphoglycolate phosphatase
MPKLKLLVCDWDGTIVNSVNQIIACKYYLADKYGLKRPKEKTIRAVLGIRFKTAMQTCFPDIDTGTLRQICNEFHSLMQHEYYQANLFAGVISTLQRLKTHGTYLAVATSKVRLELDSALQHTGLGDMFDLTCCSEEHTAKPAPDMLYFMMNYFKVAPCECIMIGDTTTDVLFANAANIATVCVSFGAHNREQLETTNPMAIIDRWEQLPNTIGAYGI